MSSKPKNMLGLTAEQRAELLRIIDQGDELSTEWAKILFPPDRREHELVYHGKERREDVIANTLSVPLQPMRSFANGQPNGAWHNMLIFGDNLQVMKTLLKMKESGKLRNEDGSDGIRMIYIDPPFATKRDFSGSREQKAYQDKIAGASFIEFLRKRLVLIRELLADNGSVFVHLDQRKVHYIKVVMDEIFGEQNFRNEIIWRSTNTHNSKTSIGQIHQTILYYTKSDNYQFYAQRRPFFKEHVEANYRHQDERGYHSRPDITGPGIRSGDSGKPWHGYDPTDSGRHWAISSSLYEQITEDISEFSVQEKLDFFYRKGLIYMPAKEGGQPRGKQYLNPEAGNLLQDIWAYQPYTSGVYQDSNDCIDQDVQWLQNPEGGSEYPTQKPEGVLARLIRLTTKQGDLVLDAFAGSGTTCAAAEKLGRRWVAVDCGKLAIYTIQKRMLTLTDQLGQGGQRKTPKPFTLYNAGLYDFSTLRQLPWEDWRFFALQLFQCRDDVHKIGGVHLDGFLRGSSVLVFNHMKEKGVRIDEETIESLHHALGSKVGSRMFIIAPALTFDFQQDYLDVDGVRYYALRIPYSIIHELHQREFTALKQPSDELEVNDTVEAVGFDFIRTPDLKFESGLVPAKGKMTALAYLRILQFKSEAAVKQPLRIKTDMDTLSMVMIDYDFDSDQQVFELDDIVYAETMRAQKWEFRFPANLLGERMMAVFIDIYGNEARIVLDKNAFGKDAHVSDRQAVSPQKSLKKDREADSSSSKGSNSTISAKEKLPTIKSTNTILKSADKASSLKPKPKPTAKSISKVNPKTKKPEPMLKLSSSKIAKTSKSKVSKTDSKKSNQSEDVRKTRSAASLKKKAQQSRSAMTSKTGTKTGQKVSQVPKTNNSKSRVQKKTVTKSKKGS